MHVFESHFYSLLMKLSNFILLNLLWLIMCLPIITVFSSTSAMFGVIHHWRTENDHEIIQPFFANFIKTFKPNLLLNVVACGVFAMLAMYLSHVDEMPPLILMFSWIAVGITIFLTISILVYYFPMVVRFPKTKTRELVIHSIVLAVNQLPVTLLASLGIIIGGIAISVFPFLGLCFISMISYYVFFCSEKVFQKVKTF